MSCRGVVLFGGGEGEGGEVKGEEISATSSKKGSSNRARESEWTSLGIGSRKATRVCCCVSLVRARRVK